MWVNCHNKREVVAEIESKEDFSNFKNIFLSLATRIDLLVIRLKTNFQSNNYLKQLSIYFLASSYKSTTLILFSLTCTACSRLNAPGISLPEFCDFSEKPAQQSSLSIGIIVWYYTFGSVFSVDMVQVHDLSVSKTACSKPTEVRNSLSVGWPHHN